MVANCRDRRNVKLKLADVQEQTLVAEQKLYLASEVGLKPSQVVSWFQNRRSLLKSKKTR